MGRKAFDWVEAALWYADQDWPVIPFYSAVSEGCCDCRSWQCAGSHPRLPLAEATVAERNIKAWADLWEESEVGVLLGPESGLIVLEVAGRKGTKTLERITKEAGRLPASFEAREGSRRLCFFAYPEAFIPKAVDFGPGMRLFGHGKTVRLPPVPTASSGTDLFWAKRPGLFGPSQFPLSWLEHAGIETMPVLAAEGAASPSSSLPFRVLDAAMLEGHARTQWVARPFAAVGALTILAGTPMSGKTTFLVQLARRVLEGPVRRELRRGAVVYLTNEGPNTFARALLAGGLDKRVLPALSILHAEDVEEQTWGALLRAACDRCAAVGARLLVIDGLERFSGRAGPQDVDPGPLLRAAARGVSVVGACQLPPSDAGTAGSPVALGSFGSAADTILRLQRAPSAQGRAMGGIEAWSRFEEVPDRITYELTGRGLVPVGGEGPLFQTLPPSPPRSRSAEHLRVLAG